MKILIIAKGDWSGAGYALSRAVSANTKHEIRAISYTQPHSYVSYSSDLLDLSIDRVEKWWNWADVVNIHDDGYYRPFFGKLEIKPVVHTYHGTWYRDHLLSINNWCKFMGWEQTCLTQDLSLSGPEWIGRPIEDMHNAHIEEKDFIVFHSPTSRRMKGTDIILKELQNEPKIKLKLVERASNYDCLSEKSRASVVIDQIGPGPGSNGFGTNALEAWAFGVPVICGPREEVAKRMVELMGYLPFASPTEDLSLRDLVLRFREDKDYYNKFRNLGKLYIQEFHNPKTIAEKFEIVCYRALELFNPTKEKLITWARISQI